MGDLAFARPSKPLCKFMADFGPTHAFLVDKGMAEYTTTGFKEIGRGFLLSCREHWRLIECGLLSQPAPAC